MLRPAPLALATAALLGIAGAPAGAEVHPLNGHLRLELGWGPPVPITPAPVPGGRVEALPGATLMQTTGASPRQISLAPHQLSAPVVPFDLPVFVADPGMFQIHTAVSVQWPAAPVVLAAGGRTGPATLTFCPGQTATVIAGSNPGCSQPQSGVINGRVRYTRTANQFGGPASASVGGIQSYALRVAAGAPCHHSSTAACQARFVVRPAKPTRIGGAFGSYGTTMRPPPSPGIFHVGVTAMGAITSVTPTGLGPGLASIHRSFAAPWTTGMLTISTTQNIGVSPQIFVLSGSDARVDGVGTLSLVGGSFAWSTLEGPQIGGGWLQLEIRPASAEIVSLRLWAWLLVAGLLAAGARRLRGASVRA